MVPGHTHARVNDNGQKRDMSDEDQRVQISEVCGHLIEEDQIDHVDYGQTIGGHQHGQIIGPKVGVLGHFHGHSCHACTGPLQCSIHLQTGDLAEVGGPPLRPCFRSRRAIVNEERIDVQVLEVEVVGHRCQVADWTVLG